MKKKIMITLGCLAALPLISYGAHQGYQKYEENKLNESIKTVQESYTGQAMNAVVSTDNIDSKRIAEKNTTIFEGKYKIEGDRILSLKYTDQDPKGPSVGDELWVQDHKEGTVWTDNKLNWRGWFYVEENAKGRPFTEMNVTYSPKGPRKIGRGVYARQIWIEQSDADRLLNQVIDNVDTAERILEE